MEYRTLFDGEYLDTLTTFDDVIDQYHETGELWDKVPLNFKAEVKWAGIWTDITITVRAVHFERMRRNFSYLPDWMDDGESRREHEEA